MKVRKLPFFISSLSATATLFIITTLWNCQSCANIGHQNNGHVEAAAGAIPIPTLSKHPVLIVISFDGFRYNFFEETNTPNMDEIGYKEGVRSMMKNQFPTKTFPNHHSIVTGLHPESHGVIGNSVFDPLYNRTLGVGDEEFWKYDENVIPIWVLNEWAGDNRTSGVMMWPGCEYPYGANKTSPTYHQSYDTSIPYDKRLDTLISWITNEERPANLILVHFEEPDSTAHAWGPNSTQTKAVIQQMDQVTGNFINRLKELHIYNKVNLILLSDHGFASVPVKNIINITSVISPSVAGYNMHGKSPVIDIAPISTDPKELETLFNAFESFSKLANFTVYKKSEVDKVKPYWFYQHNRRIMELFIVADPGYVFDDFYHDIFTYYAVPPYNHPYSEDAVYGTHGYDSHEMSMHPFFMAVGPLFHSGGKDVGSFDNIDLFPLFCHISGFGPPRSNGTSDAIRLLLAQEKQFHLGATAVGWIVVIAVIFGLLILTLILSLLRQRTPSALLLRNKSGLSGGGYRFVKNERDYYDEDDDELEGGDYSETKILVNHANANSDDEDDDEEFIKMEKVELPDDKQEPIIVTEPNANGAIQVQEESSSDRGQGQESALVNPPTSTISSTSINNIREIDLYESQQSQQTSQQSNQLFPLIDMLDDDDDDEIEEFRAPIRKKTAAPAAASASAPTPPTQTQTNKTNHNNNNSYKKVSFA